ncbi:uncharacterized protein HMPREF1120_04493 [Exophiala dermatitidis NIH/UT8656]|uniref:Uncharacterized protein n=1 Tax=Exophiala dermatitidis (strain ATCC 34100 / CBS 525.76 / NIH/UT8656) TaxID=858893 RepID=H6C0I3_EXODN|nr:uncharacterized protein HMPREF1120_04493 [Exophiala dermatitidis NIH/UT8656]EHY56411.1 hypothetical protein HMPREF1120_04493 [Exophiala dermatitidis NIH/UT8656]
MRGEDMAVVARVSLLDTLFDEYDAIVLYRIAHRLYSVEVVCRFWALDVPGAVRAQGGTVNKVKPYRQLLTSAVLLDSKQADLYNAVNRVIFQLTAQKANLNRWNPVYHRALALAHRLD